MAEMGCGAFILLPELHLRLATMSSSSWLELRQVNNSASADAERNIQLVCDGEHEGTSVHTEVTKPAYGVITCAQYSRFLSESAVIGS